MNTKNIISTVIGSVILAFSTQASADVLTVACYNEEGHGVYYGFDTVQKQFTYSYGTESCLVDPNGAWSDAHSRVEIDFQANVVKAETQIILGDVLTPVFECNADIRVEKNSNGDWILKKGTVWHNEVKIEHKDMIGSRCYVQ